MNSLQDEVLKVASTPEIKLFLRYLNEILEEAKDQLVGEDSPTTRGRAQLCKELVDDFTPESTENS